MLQTDRQKNTLFWQGRRMVKMNIALDEIRNQAPEGATHYDRDNDYLRLHKNKWSVWNSFHEIWQPMHTPSEESIARFKIKPL